MNTSRIRAVIVRSSLVGVIVLGLAATVTASEEVEFKTELLSTSELSPHDADGTGKADVSVDLQAGMVCFEVEFEDSGTPNRAHIHAGNSATAGPIVVAFFDIQTADQALNARHDELEATGGTRGCVQVNNPTLLADIVAHPDLYYVNLHNARFPAGSMRGQLDD